MRRIPVSSMVIHVSILLAFSGMSPLAADPATEEQAVLAAVQKFFDGMTVRDVDAMRSVLVPEGRILAVRYQLDGSVKTRGSTNGEFLDRLSDSTEIWLERMWEPTVLVHKDMAVVWTSYDFHRDGKFSHCGVDAFNLVKLDGCWKICNGTYTVEPEGCAQSPLGPVKKSGKK